MIISHAVPFVVVLGMVGAQSYDGTATAWLLELEVMSPHPPLCLATHLVELFIHPD